MSSFSNPQRKKPVFKAVQVDDLYKFQTPPPPPGKYPYRLNIGQILNLPNSSKMVFQMAGDTGSVQKSAVQEVIASEMIRQYNEAVNEEDKPLFLYHLGDVVYKYGEAENYYEQFFKPFKDYPGPIFAIAGNHDSDINPESSPSYKSLDAFTQVFCDTTPRAISFDEGSGRKSMIQPNIYWTLETPLANFIGLHSNVPKFGVITEEQRQWFMEELKAAAKQKPQKALIVCVHHAPYSADTNHGSSLPMIQFLESAFEQAQVKPDIVFSGHVHNYQRFCKIYDDGSKVPYVVSGAGGYHELHSIAPLNSQEFPDTSELFDQVSLEKYALGQHGFLKISIERKNGEISIRTEYYMIPSVENLNARSKAVLFDEFEVVCGKSR